MVIISNYYARILCITYTHDYICKIIARTVTILGLGTIYRQRIIVIFGISYKTGPPVPSHRYVSCTADFFVSILCLHHMCILILLI